MMKRVPHIVIACLGALALVLIGLGVWGMSQDDAARAVSSEEFSAFEAAKDVSAPVEGEDSLVGQKPAKKEKPKPSAREEKGEKGEKEGKADEAEAKAEKAEEAKPAPPKPKKVKKVDWKPAVLEIVTNFDQADVTVNGIPYPEYTPPDEPTGVVLPAGGPYWVEVTADGNSKTYEVYLRPNETRLLLVDLSGFSGKGRAPRPKPSVPEPPKKAEKKDEEKGPGKVTVYSKPPGVVMIDGEKTEDKTPGTLEVENGRHEIQVAYDGGGTSEKKIVRVREGSRIKLFFRKRD